MEKPECEMIGENFCLQACLLALQSLRNLVLSLVTMAGFAKYSCYYLCISVESFLRNLALLVVLLERVLILGRLITE